MPKKPLEAIAEHFCKVTDLRKDRTKDHKLIYILAIAICAVICGAEGVATAPRRRWMDIENFGKSKEIWLRTFLELPNGIPFHDTFGRVFSLINAQEFQMAFWEWVWAVNDLIQGQVVNIDGKCLRGSDDEKLGKRAIYMVSAWAAENEIVLGQRKVDEKSNEITAIPELLKILSISSCIVTIDAMGTQTHIAKTIVDAQADYVLSVKENQGHLYEDISVLFVVDQAHDFKYAEYEYKKTVNKGHGRIEIHECYSTSSPAYLRSIRHLHNWVGLKSIAMVICTRIIGDKITKEYVTTFPVCPAMRNVSSMPFAKIRLLKIWQFCATLLSTCSNRKKLPKVASMPNNSKPPGTKITCSRYSPLKFRCDCPAIKTCQIFYLGLLCHLSTCSLTTY